jgi:TolB-like protein
VTENLFDKIHTDPRWLPFLRKLGKDPETLAKIEFKVTLPKEWQAEAAARRRRRRSLEQAVVLRRAQAPQRDPRRRALRRLGVGVGAGHRLARSLVRHARLGHALVRDRRRHRLPVLDRVRLVLRVHAGRAEARERGRGRTSRSRIHTGRKLDFAIIGVLALAVVLLLTDRFVLRRGVNQEAAPVPEHSIAVLPFVNMSSDKEQEYFSDGISEELLNLLAKIPQLQVTRALPRSRSRARTVAIPRSRATLHVAHVLEGSVRKSGDSVRITAQLIRAGTDKHLWSQTYDRKLDDIFAIQDEIAADVVKQLQVTLLGAAPKVRTTDPEAYALYLQAVQLGRQATAESFKAVRRALPQGAGDRSALRPGVARARPKRCK